MKFTRLGSQITNINQIDQTVIEAIAGQLKVTMNAPSFPSRAFGEIYQNTTDSIIIAVVTGEGVTTTGAEKSMNAVVSNFTPPTTNAAQATIQTAPDQTFETTKRDCITFIVPPGYYYRINASYTLILWAEYTLFLEAV